MDKATKSKLYKFSKGIFRIHTGFAVIRTWSLDKVYPKKTNVHLFDLLRKSDRKVRQKSEN